MTLRIALAQLDLLVGDIRGNTASILATWRQAAEAGADLVAFPELAVTGYPPDDLLAKPEFIEANLEAIERLAADGPADSTAVVGFVRCEPGETDPSEWDVTVAARGDLRNAAAVIHGGEVVATYDKSRLPNYGVFDEARWFSPDDEPLVVPVAGVPVGVTICEDLWTEEGAVSAAAAAGAALVVNINASPYYRGKRTDRERWIVHHTRQDGVWLAYVNNVGGQDELVFDGDSAVYAPTGEAVARAPQFRSDLLLLDVGLASDDDREDRRPLPPRQHEAQLDPVAEVWEALVLATRDYCRKNGFSRATLGLSGGIDSSVTAAIAADALGPDNVLGVSMPSPHSSGHSRTDADELAANLGIGYEVIPIDAGMGAFREMLSSMFERTEPGVAEENIQARLRGMLLMAISNKFGHLVLASGNKSEAAVGYSTLYGDMAGGFSPLKDCYKHLVYALARHRNALGSKPVIPQRVLDKEPSAELRPGQRDEDSLPPYDTLDAILAAYIEESAGIAEIASRGFAEDLVAEVIAMVDRAEHKRRQAPPGVKITEKAFGRDRRVPITNGWTGRL